jgi:hypothetical protein
LRQKNKAPLEIRPKTLLFYIATMQTKRKSNVIQQIDNLLMDLPMQPTPVAKKTYIPTKLMVLCNIAEEEEVEEKRTKRCDSGIFIE